METEDTAVEHKTVSTSSLIDLKAELFRKQEEFKQQKLHNQTTGVIKGKHVPSNKKQPLFNKKNAGVLKRARQDEVEKTEEEEDVLKKSRLILEQKASLYEKLTGSSKLPDVDENGVFLVDFEKKYIDRVVEEREKQRADKPQEEDDDTELPDIDHKEEDWVDYVDSFGRSKRCLKEDLPHIQQQDESLQKKRRDVTSRDDDTEFDKPRVKQAEEPEEPEAGPLHYTDVTHNEIRTHGVGFYKFASNEETRQSQMDQLNQIRQQTKDARTKSERIQEKRKAALAARLNKIKQRKGVPIQEETQVEPEVKPEVETPPPPVKKEPSSEENKPLQPPKVREWDVGKQATMEASERAWLKRQRQERETEFAPPSFYFTDNKSQQNTWSEMCKAKDRLEPNQKSKDCELNRAEDIVEPSKHRTDLNKLEHSNSNVIGESISANNRDSVGISVGKQLNELRQQTEQNPKTDVNNSENNPTEGCHQEWPTTQLPNPSFLGLPQNPGFQGRQTNTAFTGPPSNQAFVGPPSNTFFDRQPPNPAYNVFPPNAANNVLPQNPAYSVLPPNTAYDTPPNSAYNIPPPNTVYNTALPAYNTAYGIHPPTNTALVHLDVTLPPPNYNIPPPPNQPLNSAGNLHTNNQASGTTNASIVTSESTVRNNFVPSGYVQANANSVSTSGNYQQARKPEKKKVTIVDTRLMGTD